VLTTRGNDPSSFAIVVVCQRTHEDDLIGHLEETEIKDPIEGIDWQWVDLPARYSLEKRSTVLGFYDPRTVAGQLLWPERFTAQEIAKLEKTLGPYRAAAQLDQKPTVPGGGMFKRADFHLEAEAPSSLEIVRAWDIAATEEGANEDPDWSVGVLLGRETQGPQEGHWWVLDVVRERTEDTTGLITRTALSDGADIPVAVPLDPAATGKLWVRALKALLEAEGLEVRAYSNTGSKVVRANAWAGSVKALEWHVLERDWTETFLREVEKFWTGKHDDQVDAVSTGYDAITSDGGGLPGGSSITAEDIRKLPGLRAGR
jgi:predicted phage terminase large subunit-like protein